MSDAEDRLKKIEENIARYEQQMKDARATARKLRAEIAKAKRIQELKDKAAEADKLLEFMKSMQTADGMSVFEAYMVLKDDDTEASEDEDGREDETENEESSEEDVEPADEDADVADDSDENTDEESDEDTEKQNFFN